MDLIIQAVPETFFVKGTLEDNSLKEFTDMAKAVRTKDERFVSRYIANAIYCIIWKYRDIAIFRKYRDILMIFSVSDNGQF